MFSDEITGSANLSLVDWMGAKYRLLLVTQNGIYSSNPEYVFFISFPSVHHNVCLHVKGLAS